MPEGGVSGRGRGRGFRERANDACAARHGPPPGGTRKPGGARSLRRPLAGTCGGPTRPTPGSTLGTLPLRRQAQRRTAEGLGVTKPALPRGPWPGPGGRAGGPAGRKRVEPFNATRGRIRPPGLGPSLAKLASPGPPSGLGGAGEARNRLIWARAAVSNRLVCWAKEANARGVTRGPVSALYARREETGKRTVSSRLESTRSLKTSRQAFGRGNKFPKGPRLEGRERGRPRHTPPGPVLTPPPGAAAEKPPLGGRGS